MKRLISLLSVVLIPSMVLAAGGGFTWSHSILGWLEQPLVDLGIDPLPILDMLIISVLLILFAYIAGKPFRGTAMREPSGKADLAHFAEVVVGGILNFLDGIIRHGTGARPILPLLGTYGMFILCLNLSGLVPGFNPPTDQFNVTIAFALIIFLGTHFLGIRQHGGKLHQTISRPNAPACPVDVSNRVDQSPGETTVPFHPAVREHDWRP